METSNPDYPALIEGTAAFLEGIGTEEDIRMREGALNRIQSNVALCTETFDGPVNNLQQGNGKNRRPCGIRTSCMGGSVQNSLILIDPLCHEADYSLTMRKIGREISEINCTNQIQALLEDITGKIMEANKKKRDEDFKFIEKSVREADEEVEPTNETVLGLMHELTNIVNEMSSEEHLKEIEPAKQIVLQFLSELKHSTNAVKPLEQNMEENYIGDGSPRYNRVHRRIVDSNLGTGDNESGEILLIEKL